MTKTSLDDRRRFIGMSLAAAGVGVAAAKTQESNDAPVTPSRPVYLVIYRPGPRWIAGQPVTAQPLKEHFRYYLDLYRKGTVRLAGGFTDNTGGAAVFEAHDDAEANALIAADPAVTAQVMTYELHRWQQAPFEKYVQPLREAAGE